MSIYEKWFFLNKRVYFFDKFNVDYEKKFFFILGANEKMLFCMPQTLFQKRHAALNVCTVAILEKKFFLYA